MCALLLPLGMLWGLTACQTRLMGARTPDYDLPRGQQSGIPFRLARPVFTIEKTFKKNADGVDVEAGYQLVVEYRSDPTAVYWVTVDPAEFHETQLVLNFASANVQDGVDDPNSHGFLSGLELSGADKSSTFIQAIGKFVTDAIGLYVLARGNEEVSKLGTAAGAALFALGNNYQAFGFQSQDQALNQVTNIILGGGLDLDPRVPPTNPPLGDMTRLVLTPGAVPPAGRENEFAALQQAALERLATTIAEDLRTYHEWTGIDLLRLYALYQRFSTLASIVNEAMVRPEVLPGQPWTPAQFEALKDRIKASLTVFAMGGGFRLEEFEAASAQALLSLLLHHRFLDALDPKRTQPSDHFLGVEQRLFAVRRLRTTWEERRRLKEFLQTSDKMYGAGSAPPPDVGMVHEVQNASTRILAIDALLTANLIEASQWAPPADTSISEAQDADDVGPWVDAEKKRYRPRWVYRERVPGPARGRGKWLKEYLEALNPGCEPKEAELVVLVERSYPDREVRPDGQPLGLVSEIPLVEKPGAPACPDPPSVAKPCEVAGRR